MYRPNTSRVTYREGRSAPLKYGALAVVVIGLLISTSQTATAGWFSRGVSGDAAFAPVFSIGSESNSQTLLLPRVVRNVDPNLSRGGGDVATFEGTALVAGVNVSGVSGLDQTAPATSDQISLYLVQEGDTLSQVAKMFNVSVNTIVWGNELSSSKDIHPGETLLILPVSGVQHTVAKGDTIGGIAKKYHGDKDEIIAYNGLPSDGTLTVGEVVTIPGGEREEEKRAPSTSYSVTKIVSGGPNVSGYFIHPLPGSVKTQGLHGYNGLDFGAPAGTPIRAAAAGTVIVSRAGGWNGGYGNYVVIDHPNGTQTLYAHNTKNVVWQGQSVVQGQIIGYVGSTGRSTGNHLHFEVRGAKNPF